MKRKGNSYELGRRLVKGPRGRGARQATPCEKSTTGATQNHQGMWTKKKWKKPPAQAPICLNIFQLNICGLNKKKTELEKVLNDRKVHIALLQETLHNNADLHITGYTSYACKCTNCRGIVTYIRNDLTAEVQHQTSNTKTDIQKCTVWRDNKKYKIYNVYSPPLEECRIDDLQDNIYQNTIVAGDFNGHSPLWGYTDTNNTGKYLEELCATTNLSIVQDENSTPTLLHRAHNTLSRPDLTIISTDLDTASHIEVLPDISSDHKPILTTIKCNNRARHRQRRPRWNFKKADWSGYKETTEQELGKLLSDPEDSINILESKFTSIILSSARRHIPRGTPKKYSPFWNPDIEKAVSTRRQARETFEASPSIDNKIRYSRATATVKRTIAKSKKEKWTDTCSRLDLRKDGRKAWNLLNNLSGKQRKSNTRPITDEETPEKRANTFNKFFSSINKSQRDHKNDFFLLKELKLRERTQTKAGALDEDFTPQELGAALKKLKKKKSPGPDKVHNEMLQHLGETGKRMLLNIINNTWRKGQIPKAWKNAHIVPILKKDKDPKNPKSYRPISLTSCTGKLAERMVNRRLYQFLEEKDLLCPEQAGFRAASRTEDQLFTLCQKIQDGFQEGSHTTAIFVDLQQAYDRVWRKGLLLKMKRLNIDGNLYRWIKNFLCERTIQTKISNTLSSRQTLEEGIPQGSALSCTLFLIFINDLAKEIKSGKALYADDLVLWNTHRYARQSARHLNSDLERIAKYCTTWKITINVSKTAYSIFTLSPKVHKQTLNIRIGSHQLVKEENPTYLGVQLDSRLTLKRHVLNLKKKATKRLSLLKRLASSTWGSDMNTLRTLYIGYIRSILDYNQCLQVACSKTTQAELDKVQNHALRFICGGMKSTPTAACEIHTAIEPLELRREKAALEMFERAKRMSTEHPARQIVDNWRKKERIKHQSVMHHISNLRENCHLPNEREPIQKVPVIPSHTKLSLPEIKTTLNNKQINKKSDLLELKTTAEDTISEYPPDWIHVYTDGSAFKATINAGYGVWIGFPDGTRKEISAACGSVCSNYEAEIKGILSAVEYLHSTFQTQPQKISHTVIFTDSKSALEALEDQSTNSTEISKAVLQIHRLLTVFPIRLLLQWIPGHTDIPGNERADRLSKRGAQQEQPQVNIPYTTARQIIRNNYKMEWMNQWATGQTGREVYKYMNKINPKDNLKVLPRKDQVAIFRLRTQHAPLNCHLNRINPQRPPMCPLCNAHFETTEHLLFRCPGLQDLRQELLPPSPDINNTLYSTADQLRKTSNYYHMALGRRASSQGPLD